MRQLPKGVWVVGPCAPWKTVTSRVLKPPMTRRHVPAKAPETNHLRPVQPCAWRLAGSSRFHPSPPGSCGGPPGKEEPSTSVWHPAANHHPDRPDLEPSRSRACLARGGVADRKPPAMAQRTTLSLALLVARGNRSFVPEGAVQAATPASRDAGVAALSRLGLPPATPTPSLTQSGRRPLAPS